MPVTTAQFSNCGNVVSSRFRVAFATFTLFRHILFFFQKDICVFYKCKNVPKTKNMVIENPTMSFTISVLFSIPSLLLLTLVCCSFMQRRRKNNILTISKTRQWLHFSFLVFL
jgi:hypothetical protein